MTDAHVRLFDDACGAVFSRDRSYRYAIWRNWDEGGPRVLFVGLNPSTADESTDDPTIRRCAAYARDWGYGGLLVGNLFAYRATRPEVLRRARRPIGSSNGAWLDTLAAAAERIVVCWGNHGRLLEQDASFVSRYANLYCLAQNRNGAPTHPLYLRKDLRARPFQKGSLMGTTVESGSAVSCN